MVKKSSGRKAIESYIKHEDMVDNAVKLGKASGLDVSPTEGNDPKGDVKVSAKDTEAFLKLLSETIDKNQAKRGGSNA
ncbi:TPA: hypothetical protein ACMDSL_002047 [Vibrio parahaemolyticus]|uniref:hypothetical protein n=1 Tax=Vibrio harveyi TaxID=669 RepID=UPI001D27E1EA|nr:hypothetical protein [Vibrio parahaemolyticus]EJG0418785.1 hypothetical protein [Vibrio parahaemolyticus]